MQPLGQPFCRLAGPEHEGNFANRVMSKIFISYRREDTESTTGRIYERLAQEYGRPERN